MSEAITVGGEFWAPTMPDVRVRGEYSDEPWRVPRRLPIAPAGPGSLRGEVQSDYP